METWWTQNDLKINKSLPPIPEMVTEFLMEISEISDTPSHNFVSWAPQVEHWDVGFGSPNFGSFTWAAVSINNVDIFSCYRIEVLFDSADAWQYT